MKCKLSAEEFVKVWQKAAGYAEIKKATGFTAGAISMKAHQLRKHGIPLKRFREKLDIPALKKLAESLT